MPRKKSVASLERILRNTREPSLRRKLKLEIKNAGKGRGSPTRGWAANAPQEGVPRRELYERCGSKFFRKSRKVVVK